MTKLKLLKNKKKYKLYNLRLTNLKKTTKFNSLLNLGNYISNIKLYLFMYSKIISYFKLGSIISKQFVLISLYYLINLLYKNIK